MIHGPGNKGNLNLLYNFVKKGFPYPLADFQNERSFLSVGNLCFVISELLKRENTPAGIYNFSDDKALFTNEVVNFLSESLGKNPLLWPIPKPLIKGIVRIGNLLKLPLNSERIDKLTQRYVVGNEKIKIALNIKLTIGSRKGLSITANSLNDDLFNCCHNLMCIAICSTLFFKLADYYNIVNKPNECSSHHQVTIRGGGIIFCLGAILLFSCMIFTILTL